MEGVEIRPPTAEDEPDWRRLWTAYLEFYKATVPESVYRTTWQRLHSGGEFEPRCLLAVVEAKPVGLVQFIQHRTCWSEKNNCYLQDLFVDPALRGTGLGRVLIEAVYGEADKAGITNVYWMTHETNVVGQRPYDRIARKTGFIEYER
ncbi:MAG: GNAT family N-acetyltransferase [Mesorhizobium sp.]|nr:GNAT family N-acetyltransferase [Mesorhizobium sp.]